MSCRIAELRNKQVVCVRTGNVLGYVSDIEIDVKNGKLVSVIIFGRPKMLGLFGKYEDIVIPWNDIEVIGTETILVSSSSPYCIN